MGPCDLVFPSAVFNASTKIPKPSVELLNGIQTAINEGLGITVLAKSTVPPGLHILPPSPDLPDLGQIGVCLVNPQKVRSEAIELLAKTMVTELAT